MVETTETTNLGTMMPRRAIRHYCLDCCGSAAAVKDCGGDTLYFGSCKFFQYRMGRGRPSVKLIRKNCLWCMGGYVQLVKDCPSQGCGLLPYRFGKNPKVHRQVTTQQLDKLKKGLARYRRVLKAAKPARHQRNFHQEGAKGPNRGFPPRGWRSLDQRNAFLIADKEYGRRNGR